MLPQVKDYKEANKFYSDAINLDRKNPVYYSNRSACQQVALRLCYQQRMLYLPPAHTPLFTTF